MKLTIAIYITAIAVFVECEDKQIDYYESLIEKETEKALAYKFQNNARNYSASDERRKVEDIGEYDYIIIGSGSAGSVVANRLSEIANISIFVLEAGNFENNFTDIPSMALFAQGSFYNWGFRSVPQTNACLGMVDKRCIHHRGRGFGGTSIINGMIYSRGGRSDYDTWGSQNEGWDYDTVLSYFLKSENSQIKGDCGYHAKGGNVNVEHSKYKSPHLNAYLRANLELGRKIIDYNGKELLGVSQAQFNAVNGRRQSVGKAYINPAIKRKNLHLSSDSYVTKIDIDGKSKVAHAVRFSKNKRNYIVRAKREIVLSAGTIMSPHILMLSGVGPEKHLKENQIPVINNLEVGGNFQDQPGYVGLNILSNVSIPLKPIRGYIEEYLNGTGIYTLPANNEAVGYFKTDKNTSHSADIEIKLVSANRTNAYFQKQFDFTDSTTTAVTKNINNPSTFTMYEYVLHPKSVGTIRLKSNDSFDFPVIDPKIFQDKNGEDIETMLYGIKLILEMLETKAFKRVDARLGKVVVPECEKYEYLSDEFWVCSIKHLSINLYHPVGTCKMGPAPKNGAVVDNKLRVHGIKNLRVADASVIPFSLSGHPNTPTVMVGERVSDFIKETLK